MLKVDVLDTTGAGDGFLGGFLHYTVKKGVAADCCLRIIVPLCQPLNTLGQELMCDLWAGWYPGHLQ